MSAAPPTLKPLQAIEDGWAAFARAPWTFLLFELLAGGLALLFALISFAGAARLTSAIDIGHPVVAWLAVVLGLAGYGVTTTWGMVGLVRGAQQSLQGQRPAFANLIRFDGAVWALLWRWLLVGLALILVKLIFGLVGFGLYSVNALLTVITAVIAFAVALYLVVNQQFFLQITLFEERNLINTIQRGRQLNDPRWWRMLGFLVTLSFVNLLLGLLLLYTGFILAIPLMLCISTAAYQQLRDPLS